MHSFLRFPNFRKKALTLSYDDGVIYDEKLIAIMNEHGLKGTFNLNAGRFDEPHPRLLGEKRAVALYKDSGHEVAVHSYTHPSLAELPEPSVAWEVLADRKRLEETFGVTVRGMAYPNGSYDDRVVEILKKCGIVYSRTVVSTEKFDIPTDWLRLPATCHHNNPKLMELADKFLDDTPARHFWYEKPKLFYLWGHSYEFNDNDNWDVIEKFAAKVGSREDVWYATNIEVYDYVKAFEALVFSVDLKRVSNPSAQDLWICVRGQNAFVPKGATVTL